MRYLIGIFLFVSMGKNPDPVFFQSDAISHLNLEPYGTTRIILDDQSAPVEVESYVDELGVLYWHRKLHTPVCRPIHK